jgi:DNA-binding response OmpR family regulator
MVKILIIDDEAPIRKMLKKLLERNDYEVLEASDGNQGIKLFNEHEPDLIITDLIMPDKEGLETIRELKKSNPDVPIIAISGGGITDPKMYLNLASKFGAVRTFAKPVDNDILLSTIKEILA